MPDAPSRSRLPLLALAIAAFAIGTTEFVVMGLLPQIAEDLQVTIPQAGLLVSGYAMGVVAGGPVLAALTARLPRKTALLLLLGVFVAGNLGCALAPHYASLMAARFLAAFSHGSFFGMASLVARHVAAPGRAAQALSLMFAGLTVANIFGVPAGALLGELLGWRATFWAVVALGAIALLGVARYVPRLHDLPRAPLSREFAALGRAQVLLALAMTVFGFGGVFTVFTYIVPILREEAGIAPGAISPILMLFGLGSTLGLLVGGRLADRALMRTIVVALSLAALLYLVFALTLDHAVAAVIGVFVLGALGFASGPALQARLLHEASDAPLLASTVNQSAFNLGNAGGAFVGAQLLTAQRGYPSLGLAAAAITTIGIGLTLLSLALERRGRSRRAAH